MIKQLDELSMYFKVHQCNVLLNKTSKDLCFEPKLMWWNNVPNWYSVIIFFSKMYKQILKLFNHIQYIFYQQYRCNSLNSNFFLPLAFKKTWSSRCFKRWNNKFYIQEQYYLYVSRINTEPSKIMMNNLLNQGWLKKLR